MGHEISQFDIPDHQLLASKAQQEKSVWEDIGEAKITRTIFGGSKIRIIRTRDKKRRAWLLAALAVVAIATAGWQGWIALQQTELFSPLAPLNERIRVSAPVFEPEDVNPSATTTSARNKQKSLTQIILDSMTTRRPPPPQPRDLKPPETMAAKPVAAQPLVASQPAPLATNNNSAKTQTDVQQPTKSSATIQPASPVVTTPSATQPAANKPAVVAPFAVPLTKEGTSPPGDNQSSGTVNVQP